MRELNFGHAGRGSAPQEQSYWDSRPWVDPNRAV